MKNLFKSLRKPKSQAFITVVSDLPRSGTSIMMKMLEAGGLPPLTDILRTAEGDHAKGYYEFERVKKMPDGDISWIEDLNLYCQRKLSHGARLNLPADI